MPKWHVYGVNDERIATIEGRIQLSEGGAVVFSDHLGPFVVYAPYAYGNVTRADWEEDH